MQQAICTALDYLPYGDGLPGEEVGAALGDGVAAVDAAGRLWALWRGGGGVFVGEGQPFGLQGRQARGRLDAVFVLARAGAPSVGVGQQPAGVVALCGHDEANGRLVLPHYLHLIPPHGKLPPSRSYPTPPVILGR